MIDILYNVLNTAARRVTFLAKLSNVNYELKQCKFKETRHSNTGAWLISSSEFKSWEDSSSSSILACYGIRM